VDTLGLRVELCLVIMIDGSYSRCQRSLPHRPTSGAVILMAHDRTGDQTIPLTYEFLSRADPTLPCKAREGRRCILVDVGESDLAALVTKSYLPKEASRDPVAIKAD
jgi:hypothetical protein